MVVYEDRPLDFSVRTDPPDQVKMEHYQSDRAELSHPPQSEDEEDDDDEHQHHFNFPHGKLK